MEPLASEVEWVPSEVLRVRAAPEARRRLQQQGRRAMGREPPRGTDAGGPSPTMMTSNTLCMGLM